MGTLSLGTALAAVCGAGRLRTHFWTEGVYCGSLVDLCPAVGGAAPMLMVRLGLELRNRAPRGGGGGGEVIARGLDVFAVRGLAVEGVGTVGNGRRFAVTNFVGVGGTLGTMRSVLFRGPLCTDPILGGSFGTGGMVIFHSAVLLVFGVSGPPSHSRKDQVADADTAIGDPMPAVFGDEVATLNGVLAP